MLDAPGNLPAGDVHRVGIRVHQRDVLLVLVAGDRVELAVGEQDHRVVGLGVGNRRRVRPRDRIARHAIHIVRDEQVGPPDRQIVVLDHVDRVPERLVPHVALLSAPGPGIGPLGVIARHVRRHHRVQFIDPILDEPLLVRRPRRVKKFVHDRSQTPQEHGPHGVVLEQRVDQVVPVRIPLLAILLADERMRRLDDVRSSRHLVVVRVNHVAVRAPLAADPVGTPC